MSIAESIGALGSAKETLDHAVQQASEAQQFGGDAIQAISEIGGSNMPTTLTEALELASAAQHGLEEAVGQFTQASEKVEEYIGTLQS